MGLTEFNKLIDSSKLEYLNLNSQVTSLTSQLATETDLYNKLKASQLFTFSPNLLPPISSWKSHPENPHVIDNEVLFNGKPTIRLGNTDIIPPAGVEAWIDGGATDEGDMVFLECFIKTNSVILNDNEGRCGGRIGVDLRGFTDDRIIQGMNSPVFHSAQLNKSQSGIGTIDRKNTNGWIRTVFICTVQKQKLDAKGNVVWAVPKRALPTLQQWPHISTGKGGLRTWFSPVSLYILKPNSL